MGKKWMGLLTVSCVFAASVLSVSAADYENAELWEMAPESLVEWEGRDEGTTIADYFDFGSDGFDIGAFTESGLGEGTIQYWTNYAFYTDPMAEEVVSYWADLGVVKEVHDADDPENMWASYVPAEGLEEGNEALYPVVFVWHGNTNSIWVAETFGFAQLGAEEGYITIIPEASNGDNAIEEFDRIMTWLTDNGYPIDESRVYCCGFSKGGYVVQNLANAYPTRIAGITAGGNIAHTPEGHDEWITFTEEEIAALADTRMPFLDYSGTFDSNNYPLSEASHMDEPEEKIAGFNLWLAATGAIGEELTLEASEEISETSDDIVRQLIGIDFAETEIRELDDTDYYIGSFQNEDGATVYEWVCIEGQMHWPAPSMPSICWEFLSQFSRDVETGELICS